MNPITLGTNRKYFLSSRLPVMILRMIKLSKNPKVKFEKEVSPVRITHISISKTLVRNKELFISQNFIAPARPLYNAHCLSIDRPPRAPVVVFFRHQGLSLKILMSTPQLEPPFLFFGSVSCP